jgi:ParB family chromosome partitioning protein
VRPIAGFIPPKARSAPIGGITRTLGNITQKFERAQDIEKQLAEGKLVVELDPALVDNSFISDRLGMDPTELGDLVNQIREHGQQVPILVRPHPMTGGRYQVAYGHRRLAAVRQLGFKVKAVIREMSDDQLVVSQGQENNARTNLTYIERALFASRLEDRSFERDVIMAALNVDKAALSKMISVVRQIPIELIEAIGAAPQIGRRRWLELAEKLASAQVELKRVLASLSADNSSDERFQEAFDALTPSRPITEAPGSKPWSPEDGSVSVTVKTTAKRVVVTYEAKNGPSFATYIAERLDELYEAFRRSENTSTGV